MKLYVSGPMSNRPFYNFPAFEAYTASLRGMGHQVWSPAEMDEDEGIEADPNGVVNDMDEYAGFLLRDLRIIAADRIEGIVVLPGWEESKGAVTEVAFGRALKLPVFMLWFEPRTRDVRLVRLYDKEVLDGMIGRTPGSMKYAWNTDEAEEETSAAT